MAEWEPQRHSKSLSRCRRPWQTVRRSRRGCPVSRKVSPAADDRVAVGLTLRLQVSIRSERHRTEGDRHTCELDTPVRVELHSLPALEAPAGHESQIE
jgi:hypothetical protein